MEEVRVLLVLGDAELSRTVARALRQREWRVTAISDGAVAASRLDGVNPNVVVYDGDLVGAEFLERVRQWDATVGLVAVMEQWGTDDIVSAVRRGVDEVVARPVAVSDMVDAVLRSFGARRVRSLRSRAVEGLAQQSCGFSEMVGMSPPMQALYRAISQVASSRASVLICGESGTGKELVARAIHNVSPRRKEPLVTLNCAALAPGVLESELFGHEKGAFTGAIQRRQGRFEQADGGTLFLDEVGEIPLPTQVKLLRVLQERSFERVGGNETVEVDVRIVAATNRDLPQQVKEGLFREDLYYRLNVVSLYVPALRERVQDIPLLVMHFARLYGEQNGRHIEGVTDRALQRLMSHPWPGNVREVENAVERAVVLANSPVLDEQHFDLGQRSQAGDQGPPIPGATLSEIERYAILKTLDAVEGSTSKAAWMLGISVRTIQYRLRRYRVEGQTNK
ncbi:MAG: sigma-54-dependent Fis family transcriptional regulator [Deltaproteobacteria bacterium]|nr:sigma-54-dependent Fis family transcriptional regulator [Deltaproteobacteria bacterium]